MTEPMSNRDEASATAPELRETEALVDRFARAERERAAAGLESRVFAASRGALHGEDLAELRAPIPFPTGGAGHRMRLAAAIVLVAGAGIAAVAWLASRGPVSAPSSPVASGTGAQAPAEDEAAALESDLEMFLASATEMAPISEFTDADDASDESFWGSDDEPTLMQDGI